MTKKIEKDKVKLITVVIVAVVLAGCAQGGAPTAPTETWTAESCMAKAAADGFPAPTELCVEAPDRYPNYARCMNTIAGSYSPDQKANICASGELLDWCYHVNLESLRNGVVCQLLYNGGTIGDYH